MCNCGKKVLPTAPVPSAPGLSAIETIRELRQHESKATLAKATLANNDSFGIGPVVAIVLASIGFLMVIIGRSTVYRRSERLSSSSLDFAPSRVPELRV